jgi:hypothetical protein
MCRHHCGHPAIERHHFTTKIKSITAADKSIIQDLSAAHAAPAVGANIIFSCTKSLIMTRQVRYLKEMHNKGVDDDGELTTKSSALDLLQVLQLKELKHEVLFSRKEAQLPGGEDGNKIITETVVPTDASNSASSSWVSLDLPKIESGDISSYSDLNRRALDVKHHQDSMLAVAWVIQSELRLFRQFPEVLKIDTTFGTNVEKRCLWCLERTAMER